MTSTSTVTSPRKPSTTRKSAQERRKSEPDAADAPAAPPKALVDAVMDVRWRDLDAFNHVNNSSFLTFIEEARLRWFTGLPGGWLDENIAPLLAAANVNYRRPIEWPESLRVRLFAEHVGTTSLTIGHRIVSARNDAVVYSDGHSVLVWIDRRSGRPAPLPEAVRAACGPA